MTGTTAARLTRAPARLFATFGGIRHRPAADRARQREAPDVARYRPQQLSGTRRLRACADEPKKASAKVGRCLRRLHAHGLIAKIPRTRRWRVTDYVRKVMGTTMYLRERHVPNAYAGVMH